MRFVRTRRASGASLVELLAAVCILGILLALASSAYEGVVGATNAGAARGGIQTTLAAAAEAALSSNMRVEVCPSRDGARCEDSYHWENGWIAFVDIDGDGTCGPGDHRVARQEALGAHVALISSSGRRRLVFQPYGANTGSNVTFTLCDIRGPGRAVAVVANNSGRIHTVPTDPDRVAEACAAARRR
jgi:type IV fimbrial biogenesis protein FimT